MDVFLWLVCVFSIVGCGFESRRSPSVMVVAVEGLGVRDMSCSGAEQSDSARINIESGFDTLCKNGVRFTHAYTPSPLVQPAMTSLLTARYPHEHGVWHNGHTFLTASVKTTAEVAVERDYRTYFISGGPPLWRKSGLAQGFEVFEDSLRGRMDEKFRSIASSVGHFKDWLARLPSDEAFFSVIYSNDLRFPEATTVTNLGEIRSRSVRSQVEEVDESLGELFSELEAQGRWNDTYVFLTGLNGEFEDIRGRGLIQPVNLYEEAVHTALVIKPTTRDRDLGLQWKVDKNVSLADVGATLYDLFVGIIPQPPNRNFSVVSLKSVLKQNLADWSAERLLPIETSWADWHGLGGHRLSVRSGKYLFLYEDPVEAFNTLLDPDENLPLKKEQLVKLPRYQEVIQVLNSSGFTPADDLSEKTLSDLVLASRFGPVELWEDGVYEELKSATRQDSEGSFLLSWAAQIALQKGHWEDLLEFGLRGKEPLWIFVAGENLNKTAKEVLDQGACHSLFSRADDIVKKDARYCDSFLMKSLMNWVTAGSRPDKISAREKFFRKYMTRNKHRSIIMRNLIEGLVWREDWSALNKPFMADLWLALPQNKVYREALNRRLTINL